MATLHLNVEFSAVADEKGKFGRLAKLLGLADADHARGKCEHLWVACTQRGEIDLPQWLVEQILGENGPPALVEAELARWSSGRGDSKTRRLHISGAAKHCTWLLNKIEQTSKAGKARASRASRTSGKFAKSPPAETSPSELSSELRSPEEKNPPPARAIPSSTEQAPPGQSAWQRRQRWWGAMLEADARIRRAGIEQNAPMLPSAPAGENERNINACERQLLDGGFDAATVDAKMLHIVAVAEAEAMRERSRRYFKPALIWKPEHANRAVDTSLEEARRPRLVAGPGKPTAPTPGPRLDAPRAPPVPAADLEAAQAVHAEFMAKTYGSSKEPA